jgi:hypothetical protein
MANIKISELNPLLTVEDADVLPIVDNAVTKKVTAAILRSYTQGNSVLLTGAQTVAGIKTFTSQLASSVATGTAPFSVASTTKVTNLNADLLDGLSSADFQATLSGTGIVKSTAGTISYLTDNSSNWNTAFNDSITSAAVTGTTTKLLTLNQQDGGTITASWSDFDTAPVTSVFGRTGAVVAAEGDYSLTQLSDVTITTPANGQVLKYNGTSWVNGTDTDTGLTSVGLSMPSAFTVSNSPLTSNGTLAVTGAGVASQYVRGDGTLAPFPTSTGGGSSVSYYFNGGTNQGTIGGNTYYEMSKDAVIGVGADFTISSNGYISQFVTDANDPAALTIPAGNWNFEMWFSSNSNGGSPSFYLELYKYDGSTLTLISSGSATPELITNGTAINLYTTALAVPTTALTITDRLAVRVFVNNSGKTITLHTQNGHLCQAITTFSTGLTALNGLTNQVQYFATGTSGTDFGISSATSTHTFNLPTASATNRGALSSADWTTFNNKQNALTNPITGTGTTNYLPKFTGASALGNSIVSESGSAISIAGNLGVSATISSWIAQYKAIDIGLAGFIYSRNDNDETSIGTNWYRDGSAAFVYKNNGFASMYTQGSAQHTWYSAPSGTAGNAISFTQAMTLDASGRLGIGTTTPSQKLQVIGTIAAQIGVDGSDATGVRIYGSGTSKRMDFVASDGGVNERISGIGTGGVGTMTFSVNNDVGSLTERMRIAASGNVGIGTTSPSAKLHIGESGAAAQLWLQRTDGYNPVKLIGGTLSDGSGFKITMNTTDAFAITSGGNTLIGTTTDAGYKLDVNGNTRVVGNIVVPFQGNGFIGSSIDNGLVFDGSGNYGLAVNSSIGLGLIFESDGGTAKDFFIGTGNSDPDSATKLLTINTSGAATFSSSVTTGADLLINNTSVSKKGYKFQSPASLWGPQESGLYFTPADGTNGAPTFTLELWNPSGGNFTTALSVLPSGASTFSAGLGIGGATATTAGIQFPATQVASASANNLDDYEEGTWTMGVSFGGASTGITYAANSGNYVKIGKQVTVTGYIVMSNKGSAIGSAKITGLPFTISTGGANFSAISANLFNITFTNVYAGYGELNTSNVLLNQVTSLGVSSAITNTNFANNSEIIFSLTYFV